MSKKYNVTIADGSSFVVEAARFVSDGSGVRFYDAADEMVASLPDSDRARVIPVTTGGVEE